MIGQNAILEWIDSNLDNFPHYFIVCGGRGNGKRVLTKEIAKKLNCAYSEVDTKVETVRDVIDTAYTSNTDVLYCFADADTMRAEAKNAMLKITEEPPKHAYFAMTIKDDSTLLDTMKSRAMIIPMDSYTRPEILEYAKTKELSEDDIRIISEICECPGDVDMISQYNIQKFYDFVQLVLENIATVEPANAFKSANNLAIKNDEGYDLELFWKCAINIMLKQATVKSCRGVTITSKYLGKLQKVGVNKQQLYDSWVFDIRGAWV